MVVKGVLPLTTILSLYYTLRMYSLIVLHVNLFFYNNILLLSYLINTFA